MHSAQQIVQVVVGEWREVLGVSDPAPEDDFFALGGNSLMAVSLVERVESRLAIRFPLEALFIEGTLGALIKACAALAAPTGHHATPGEEIEAGARR